MIRLSLLWLFIAGVGLYAWKDWYKSLCGLILLMAVIEHPDMPKSLFGIQGLNPWNLLLLVVIMAWAVSRSREGLVWDMPRGIQWLLIAYALIMLVGFFRLLAGQDAWNAQLRLTGLETSSTAGLWSEYFLNTYKWVIPGMLLYDGCRSRARFNLGLFSLLAVYFLLALLVIKWMPLGTAASGEALTERSLKILLKEIGYHRVNLSMMLGGASWAIFACHPLVESKTRRRLIVLASLLVLFGQALTGGRTGYATWGVVGVTLGVFRWRRQLLLLPVLALLVVMIVPAARERMLQGFTPGTQDTNVRLEPRNDGGKGPDMYTITAGRNVAWPYVLEKIGERPFIGYGREAMQRTGLTTLLYVEFGESFPHPHNAYLQWILDNGYVGFLLVMLFYLVILKRSLSLFQDSRDPVFIASGGVVLSLVVALLAASVGSQTFYPREGSVGMWCAIGLMLRVFVQRSRIDPESAESAAAETSSDAFWRPRLEGDAP